VRHPSSGFAAASRFFVRTAISLMVAATLVKANAAEASTAKYSSIVIDVNTGKTMFSASADAPRYPASLTKMMTLYLLFEGLKSGKFTKSTRIPISRHAASQAPSKLGVKAGQSITVETAIFALVTKSANDAAAASGEFMGGSEERFAQIMTAKARNLGMSRTTFRNASGLPNPSQVTTARDMATLGIALRQNFPQYYGYFSTRSFTYGRSRMGNHNKLLGRVAGVDGIKTGYTRASGFNLVTSVKQGNRLVVAVVMGGKTGRARDQHMAALVKKYAPKASNSHRSESFFAKLIGKQKPVPVPEKAPVVEEAVAMEDTGAEDSSSEEADVEVAAAEADTEAAAEPEQAAVAIPAERKAAQPAPEALAFAPPAPVKRPKALVAVEQEAAPVDPITTASNDPKGWVIQIAAADSKSGAHKLLSDAKFKAGKALSSAEPFTQEVEKGSAKLYRARFSGFETKTAARNACAALKKQKISCFALNN
jgi:D-alanyl-D-alanine carboxypeptidase